MRISSIEFIIDQIENNNILDKIEKNLDFL